MADAGFLLDTNVLSEVSKPRPDARAMAWLAGADEARLFLSVATLAELNRGVEKLAAGARQRRLAEWLSGELLHRFATRILPVDAELALLWGAVVARAEKLGRPMEALDALLAATALRHALTLVTRNVSDFEALELPLLNPWSASAARD